ncbi:leucine-rich repeat domain-containing protein [Cytophaga aurantiaca]|uniref:leucine-rich repeat domain-containing protein n=1 Tax=Cytophaga aurantiaca TaxID=29530 RepID=UPI0003A33CC9|nr:protein phosphatase 1 regulatory subunit 42 [Cytophaga aurantiaca]
MKHLHYKIASIVLLMIAVSIQTVAQPFVTLPDANFKNRLQSINPSLISGNQLNIGVAQNFTGDLLLSGANISDLTGLQYFSATYKIDVSGNNVTSIPNISTTSIKYLYAYNNQLTSLPNLSALTNLIELQVQNNKLTSLPALNSLGSLNTLIATNNKLTSLPPINNLVGLKILNIGINPSLGSLPDLSPNYNLNELHCHQTGISTIPGLANLHQLKKLFCWGNSISDLSALENINTLNLLYAFQNNLSVLPTLTNKPLFALEIADNQLTFEDLLPLSSMGLFDFSYSPQDSIGVYTKVPTRLLHPLSLSVTEDAGVTGSTYTWYKNGVAIIPTTTTNQKTITTAAQTTDAGIYYVSITNTALPALTLTHRMWDVSVISCIDLISYSFSIPMNECSNGATVNSTVVLEGGVAPYQYVLTPLNSQPALSSSNGDFTQVAPGQYTYSIKDANGCGIDTTAVIQKPAKCDPVITPNGDLQMSSYFIEQTGTAKIIDIEGKTILQLTTPAVWYGTQADGTLADAGYYVIVVNNKKVTNITVIR